MFDQFLYLAEKLSPLFINVFIGYWASKLFKIGRESIAKLVIYIISPLVFFVTLIQAPFNPKFIILPFLFAGLCSIMGILTYRWSRMKSPMKNLLSYAAGSANTGYFGIPATAILLGERKLSTAIFIIIGYNVYECTTGFYLAARGNFDRRESMRKIASLPSIWTFVLALVISALGYHHFPVALEPVLISFRGCYATLGLMMIGMALGTITNFRLHLPFISSALLLKFLVFPLLAVLCVLADHATIRFLDPDLVEIILLMSLVPLAANGVSIATELKLPTDEIAFTITLSTIISIFWIPLCWATWVPWVLKIVQQ